MRALIRTIGFALISTSVAIVISFLAGTSIAQVIAVVLKYGITAFVLLGMFGMGTFLVDDAKQIAEGIQDSRLKKLRKKEALLAERERLIKVSEEETNKILKTEGLDL